MDPLVEVSEGPIFSPPIKILEDDPEFVPSLEALAEQAKSSLVFTAEALEPSLQETLLSTEILKGIMNNMDELHSTESPGQAVTHCSTSKPRGDEPYIPFSGTEKKINKEESQQPEKQEEVKNSNQKQTDTEKKGTDIQEVKRGINVTEKKVMKEECKQLEKQGEERNSKQRQTDNEKKAIDIQEVKQGTNVNEKKVTKEESKQQEKRKGEKNNKQKQTDKEKSFIDIQEIKQGINITTKKVAKEDSKQNEKQREEKHNKEKQTDNEKRDAEKFDNQKQHVDEKE